MVLAKRLVAVVLLLEMDSYTNMIDAIKCRNVKLRVSIYLALHPRLANLQGDGLFLKRGMDISDGAGLLMGAKSPFKNIPIPGWSL